uniref:Secreted protein n=1 Tax=Setaria italica TaxID=4555 RepID=K3ZGL1_SETIT
MVCLCSLSNISLWLIAIAMVAPMLCCYCPGPDSNILPTSGQLFDASRIMRFPCPRCQMF